MVKAIVLRYSDIVAPENIADTTYCVVADVKFFDNVKNQREYLSVNAKLDESDNQVTVENKIFDAIVEGVGGFGVTLTRSDVLMLAFKRG